MKSFALACLMAGTSQQADTCGEITATQYSDSDCKTETVSVTLPTFVNGCQSLGGASLQYVCDTKGWSVVGYSDANCGTEVSKVTIEWGSCNAGSGTDVGSFVSYKAASYVTSAVAAATLAFAATQF